NCIGGRESANRPELLQSFKITSRLRPVAPRPASFRTLLPGLLSRSSVTSASNRASSFVNVIKADAGHRSEDNLSATPFRIRSPRSHSCHQYPRGRSFDTFHHASSGSREFIAARYTTSRQAAASSAPSEEAAFKATLSAPHPIVAPPSIPAVSMTGRK